MGRGRGRSNGALAVAVAAALLAGCGGGTPPTHESAARAIPLPPWPHARTRARTRPAAPSRPSRPTTPRPPIEQRPIPFGPRRRAEMVAYAERHYGLHTYRLIHPHVIVEHWTETATASSAYDTFAADVPDVELHELPGTCAHFIVDRDGTIEQLVPLGVMCRHTVGLNWTAIGIEHVGMSDAGVMDDAAELRASLALTRWLRCRFGIAIRDVIGHNESLSSPYHHENVASLRTQTHDDMRPATMDRYRALLARRPCRGS